MAPVTIVVRKNGPYFIAEEEKDGIRLVDHDGNPIPIPATKKNIALCRCGASVTKPFCDGTHTRIGFRAAEEAARASGAQSEG
ncbi:MAG TPA: CDGSH iron-sulfur domain-containing protein [Gemmatimonadaceae bacterium]|nr:CDGSH iron-sulfur domain-containing protein [Gemmatimonadaceae bacterium]